MWSFWEIIQFYKILSIFFQYYWLISSRLLNLIWRFKINFLCVNDFLEGLFQAFGFCSISFLYTEWWLVRNWEEKVDIQIVSLCNLQYLFIYMQMQNEQQVQPKRLYCDIFYALLRIGLQVNILQVRSFVSVLTNFTCNSLKDIYSLWYMHMNIEN